MADISRKLNAGGCWRRSAILNAISEFGEVRVGYLSRLLHVSTATIRSDLQKLELTQEVIRVRGSVLDPDSKGSKGKLNRNSSPILPESDIPARIASALVADGQSIILDGGPFGKQMIGHLNKFRNLHLLTNDLGLALLASLYENFSVIVPGGIRKAGSSGLSGPLAANNIHQFAADKYFLYAPALDPQRGVVGFDADQAQLSLHFASIATQVVVVAGCDAFVAGGHELYCPVGRISTIITDTRLHAESLHHQLPPGISVTIL